MRAARVVAPGGGEVVGDAPERRVEILAEADALHATWTRFGPRRDGADLHVHRHHSDLFYVLAGELTLRLGPRGAERSVPVGTLARVPPLVVHGFRNGTDAELRYLNLHAPGMGFAGYLRALREGRPLAYDQEPPPDDGGRPMADAVVGAAEDLPAAPGRRVRLLADAEAVAVAETWTAADATPTPLHVHRHHLEAVYVLEGELRVAGAEGHELRAAAGAWVQVAPGTPHGLLPGGPGPVRLLEVHAPGAGFGAFLRAASASEGSGACGFDQEPAVD
jgi:quercetin dioxygenase-like cupin family protein